MPNSAQYLLQFFGEEKRAEGETFNLQRVMTAVADVDRQLDGLIGIGLERFKSYKEGMPKLWDAAWHSFQNPTNNAYSFAMNSPRELSFGIANMLRDIRDNCLTVDLTLTEEREKSLNELLEKIIETVNEDDSLSQPTKMYIVKLVHEVHLSVDLQKTGCEFELSDAIDRLLASLGKIEAVSSNKDKWRKLHDDVVNPFISALFGTVGSYVLGVATGQYQLPWQ